MRKPRIYHPAPLKIDTTDYLSAAAANHIARVLRLKKGAELILFNGLGGEYTAEIVAIEKNQVQVNILRYDDVNRESPLHVHLGQGISRGEKMDYTIQKAVELGVQEITPLFTTRSEVRLDEERSAKRMRHWEGVLISACEQAGRTAIPVIHAPCELKTWLMTTTDAAKLLFHPGATRTLSDQQRAGGNEATPSIRVLIGPEGGFNDDEITSAQKQNFVTVQLGPRILRTETAAIAALCALQCYAGDF
jgi:16S rRNA (uracil1498-N3)-methyltransferase